MHPAHSNQPPPSPAPEEVRSSSVDISIIIVNYNVREFLEQALRSIERASAGLEVEVFVVDNNSVDGSVEMVQTRFPGVRLIANEENAGFGKANNQAIREARGRYLFILNPDTILREDTLETLVSFMDSHPEAGAVGCKILNPDGTFAPESRRSFPTPAVAFYRLMGLSKLFPRSRLFGRYNLSYLSPDEETEVDALSGSCMVVRHEALLREGGGEESPVEIPTGARTYGGAGLFDEDFFMYGEDLDWCYRIQQAGWKIYYTPATQIIHYKGESTRKGELRYVMLFYGAMLRFAQKHFGTRHSFILRGLLRTGIVVRGGVQVIGNLFKRFAIPLSDLALVMVAVSLAGVLRFYPADMSYPPLFLGLVAPVFAVSAILGINLLGGYRRLHRRRILPALLGCMLGFGVVSTFSFFVQSVAFSRIALLLSLVLSIFFVASARVMVRRRRRPAHARPRAILVGDRAEAHRLHLALTGHPNPPLQLIGYLEALPEEPSAADPTVVCLGSLRHLRDTVRLRHVDDVVFAARVLSNRDIFDLIQQLQGLPVSCEILQEDRDHLIGQARIDALASPALIDAEQALGRPRSPFARRAFEIPLALIGLGAHPFLAMASKFTGRNSFPSALAAKTGRLPGVLSGRYALVGHRAEETPMLPESWHLKPGIFTLTDTLSGHPRNPQEISNAYWFYTRNQSMAFDLDVIVRCLNQLRETTTEAP